MNNKTQKAVEFIKDLDGLVKCVNHEYSSMISDKIYYGSATFNVSFATTSVYLIEVIEKAKKFAKTIRFNRALKKELLKEIKRSEWAIEYYRNNYKRDPVFTYDEVRERIFERSLVDGDVKKFIESLYE